MRFIFYDTETTGVRTDTDRVIELAAYDPSLDKKFSELIDPGIPIPMEATRIHGIETAMVQGKPSFGEVALRFIDFCGTDCLLVAHNNDTFDQPLLQNEFKRCGLEFPSFQFLDSLKWSRKYRPDLRTHTLQSLRELFGFEANQAHRALDDVITLSRIFFSLVDDLSPEQVFSLLKETSQVKKMPFGKYQGKPLSLVPKDYVAWLAKNGALDKSENTSLKEAFKALGVLN